MLSRKEREMNQSLFMGSGVFTEGVECFRFTEVLGCVHLRSFSVTPSQILPEKELKKLVQASTEGKQFFVFGQIHDGPNICMENIPLLVIIEYSEKSASNPFAESLSEGESDEWGKEEEQSVEREMKAWVEVGKFGNPTDCLVAKVIARLHPTTQRLRFKWFNAGYPPAMISCQPIPCISTQRCYRVTFHFHCIGGPDSVCLWTPIVWAVVDVSSSRVIDCGDEGILPENGYGPIPLAIPEGGPGVISSIGCGCGSAKQSSCSPGILEPTDWNAFLDSMPGPGKQPRFHAKGLVCVPNQGYKATLKKVGVAETNPPTILLEVDVSTDGPTTGLYLPTKVPARFDEVPAQDLYGWAMISLANSPQSPIKLPVQQIS